MSPLQTTNAEIRRRMQSEQARREERRLAELPIRAVDALLAQLEELHLAGRKRVPETLEDSLRSLNETLPPELRTELRSRITIVHLMDRLYAIQDRLLSRRSGAREPHEDRRRDGDEDDSLPQAS
jgi:hypothetical protein